jgi:hypothetical protein
VRNDPEVPGAELRPFYGDLHNHCDISYGQGSLDDAYRNARLQLDFASVTGHAHWPDMPPREGRLAYLVDYHQHGFDRLASIWDWVQERTEHHHEDGRFVTFLSFEWHSMRHGDYCIYYDGSRGDILRAPDIEAMRRALEALRRRGGRAMMIPHHICYVPGYRGVSWADFDPRYSPVVEIVSMHGCGESDDGPRPYLHSMGPRDGRGSMYSGLRAGHRFGVIGSTDHHAAHPGSHDHGRLGVWARELSRDALWEAIEARCTWALTGDRIELAFMLNGAPMGAELPALRDRALEARVRAGGAIDYVELVRNGEALARQDALGLPRDDGPAFRGKLALAVGWGEGHKPCDWSVELGVRNGRIVAVEPRLGANEQVRRLDPDHAYHFSSVLRRDPHTVELQTRTVRNPTTRTDGTQKLCLEIEGDGATRVIARINGQHVDLPLSELRRGPRAGFLDGFVSEAWQLSRAVPESEYAWRCTWDDPDPRAAPAWYALRVRQKNDQWAWSSPIFVGGSPGADRRSNRRE